jgi:uncharacterized Zn finger protein (UPF0148 family)
MKMNNDFIKQGAYYLLRGGTLLSEPCKKCGNLQIKFKGEVFCMNCQANNNKQEISSSVSADKESSKSIMNINDHEEHSADLIDDSNTKIEENLVLTEVEDRLIKSIADLAGTITTGQYSKEYRNTLKSIKESLKIINMIKRIKSIAK